MAGILDVLDNYAFVRTSGYLPGPNDVYVPLGLVKRYSLRKGDAVTGSIKAPREGEQPQNGTGGRQKFNALVRLDTINGLPPDQTRTRVDFGKLTPLYPQERLRLETETSNLTTRVIDLVAPIGKGQRGLIVAPSEAGNDDGAAVDRQRDHAEQPGVPPHGRPRRRAARRRSPRCSAR